MKLTLRAWRAAALVAALAVPALGWGKSVALLVGVGEYPHWPRAKLEGPPNDVAAMASVLQRRQKRATVEGSSGGELWRCHSPRCPCDRDPPPTLMERQTAFVVVPRATLVGESFVVAPTSAGVLTMACGSQTCIACLVGESSAVASDNASSPCRLARASP